MKFYLEKYCLFFRNNQQKVFIKMYHFGSNIEKGMYVTIKKIKIDQTTYIPLKYYLGRLYFMIPILKF